MIECVRRSSRNVKHWQSGEMCLRWTAAGMLEAERQFRRIVGHADLAKLAIAVERDLVTATATPRPRRPLSRHLEITPDRRHQIPRRPGHPRATTGNSVGLSKPEVTIPARDIDPMLGRFFLSRVPYRSRMISAQLDVAPQQDGAWFHGELLLHLSAGGKPSTALLAVYSFEYSEGQQQLSAELVPADSVTLAHPYGVSAGRIVFDLPLKDTGLDQNAVELKRLTATMTLNGRGPFKVAFRRASADGPPPNPLPKAKRWPVVVAERFRTSTYCPFGS